jgi:hypothetical protein
MRTIHKTQFEDRPHVLKASLMYVSDDKICDGCDEHTKCAFIRDLNNKSIILCKDCIEGILESFEF